MNLRLILQPLTLRRALACFFTSLVACATIGPASVAQDADSPANPKVEMANSVIVMGMIHSKHRQNGPFDLEHLKDLIRKVKPDYVLTEIPPDRLEEAAKQFKETGKITESRVRVFPEYTLSLIHI